MLRQQLERVRDLVPEHSHIKRANPEHMRHVRPAHGVHGAGRAGLAVTDVRELREQVQTLALPEAQLFLQGRPVLRVLCDGRVLQKTSDPIEKPGLRKFGSHAACLTTAALPARGHRPQA